MTGYPQTVGEAMRAVGRFLDAPEPASAPLAAREARDGLRALHAAWVDAGQPEHGVPSGPVAHAQDHALTFHDRGTDPSTSTEAAAVVDDREGGHHVIREGTHKARLLIVYGRAAHAAAGGRAAADQAALSDHGAAEAAGLSSGGWKRCSDLRAGGFITPDGERPGPAGVDVMVCRITEKGWRRWQELDVYAPRTPMPAASSAGTATLFP